MGWAVGCNEHWKRDIGYGVPAWCDHPECEEVIDRGLAHACCDEQPYGGDRGCGLYFCSKHSSALGRCERCAKRRKPFNAKPDHPDWINHKTTDPSWAEWRAEQAASGKN